MYDPIQHFAGKRVIVRGIYDRVTAIEGYEGRQEFLILFRNITTEDGLPLLDQVWMRRTPSFTLLHLFPGDVVTFSAEVTLSPPQTILPPEKDNEYYRQPVRLLRPTKIRKLACHAHTPIRPMTQETPMVLPVQQAQETQARATIAQHLDAAIVEFKEILQPFSNANDDRQYVEHRHPLPLKDCQYLSIDEIEQILAAAKNRHRFCALFKVHLALYDASDDGALIRCIGVHLSWSASPHPHLRPERYAELSLQIPDWPERWQCTYHEKLANVDRETSPDEKWHAEQDVRRQYKAWLQQRIEVTNAYAKLQQLDLDELSQQLALNLRAMTSEEARELRIRLNQPSRLRPQKHRSDPYPLRYSDRPLPKQLRRRDKWKRPTKRTPVSESIPLNFRLRFYVRWYTHKLPHLEDE